MSLFENLIDDEFCRLNIDEKFCEIVRNIYISNKAWTWSKSYEWPHLQQLYNLN